jgi:hypothetical protein
LAKHHNGKLAYDKTFACRGIWTLASEEVWIRTHRLSGKLSVEEFTSFLAAAIAAVRVLLAPGALL